MKVIEKPQEKEMGRVIVQAKLTNYLDLARSQVGEISSEQVRSVEVEALVDTGATMLVLPKDVAQQLGVSIGREVRVAYADGREEKRGIAQGIILEVQGRVAEGEALVEATGTKVLIGQVPLEVMDLIVDPKTQTVGPRPESPDAPLIEIY